MKKSFAWLLSAVLIFSLALTGCVGKSAFGADTQTDNTIRVTAEKAASGSAAIGTLTVGENGAVVVEASFEGDSKLQVTMAIGEFTVGALPEDATVATVSGHDTARFTIEPGTYTVEVKALTSKLTGTAVIRVEDDSQLGGDPEYYSAVTAMPKAEVEDFAIEARDAYLYGDWAKLSEMIAYPITIYPDVVVNSADEFMSYMDGKTATDLDLEALGEETCSDMFFTGVGICLGAGQLWLADDSYMTDNEPNLRVIAVNGISAK